MCLKNIFYIAKISRIYYQIDYGKKVAGEEQIPHYSDGVDGCRSVQRTSRGSIATARAEAGQLSLAQPTYICYNTCYIASRRVDKFSYFRGRGPQVVGSTCSYALCLVV